MTKENKNVPMYEGTLIDKNAYRDAGKAIDTAMTAYFKDFDPRLFVTLDPKIYQLTLDRSILGKLGIRIDNSGSECGQIASLRMNPKGQFWVATDCADDKGKIRADDETKMFDVILKQAFFEWSDTDVRCSQQNNINLLNRLQSLVYDVYFSELVEAIFLGVFDNKTDSYINQGIFTNPAFNKVTPALDLTKLTTPDALFGAVSNFIMSHNAKIPLVYQTYAIDTVIAPKELYLKLSSTMFSTGVGVTVLSALQIAFPNIAFMTVPYASNIGGKKYMVGFNRSQNIFILRVPMPLRYSSALQTKGFCWRMDAKYAIAGLDIMFDGAGSVIEVVTA